MVCPRSDVGADGGSTVARSSIGSNATEVGRSFAINHPVTPFESKVRARVYTLLVEGVREVDVGAVAESGGWASGEVAAAFATPG